MNQTVSSPAIPPRHLQFLALCLCFLLFDRCHCNEEKIQFQINLLRQKSPRIEELLPDSREQMATLYQKLGNHYRDSSDWLQAAIAYRKSLSISKNPPPALQLHIGNAYFKRKLFNLAETFFLDFCKAPENVKVREICAKRLYEIYQFQGSHYRDISLWDKAIEQYAKAQSSAPNSLLAVEMERQIQRTRFKKAVYQYSQKHYLESSHTFLKILSPVTSDELLSKVAKIATHLFINSGKHYEKIGETHKAIPFYKAVTSYFSHPTARQYAKKRLKTLQKREKASRDMPTWLSPVDQ